MLIKEECLQLIANQRTDEVVVTTMGTTVPWGKISTHPLDYALSEVRWDTPPTLHSASRSPNPIKR